MLESWREKPRQKSYIVIKHFQQLLVHVVIIIDPYVCPWQQ